MIVVLRINHQRPEQDADVLVLPFRHDGEQSPRCTRLAYYRLALTLRRESNRLNPCLGNQERHICQVVAVKDPSICR